MQSRGKSVLVMVALMWLAVALARAQSHRQPSLPAQMQRLLNLPHFPAPLATETLQQQTDGDVIIEDVRFRAERGVWIPALVIKPVQSNKPLPAIICLPGTGGTRHNLADARLQLSERPRTGWARALAREGFLTIALDYRGSDARQQNIFTEAVREQLAGRSYMGLLVAETIRTVDYLQTRPDVNRSRIGITGFSLGGAISWYAAAADSRLSVIVPVCSGAGTYEAVLRSQRHTAYHSQYFYPAGFLQAFPGDQPGLFAALAPRAVLVLGRDQDQGMPVEGLHKLQAQVSTAYRQRGAAERFAVHITAGDHTYTEEMFTQVKQWFLRFLLEEK